MSTFLPTTVDPLEWLIEGGCFREALKGSGESRELLRLSVIEIAVKKKKWEIV